MHIHWHRKVGIVVGPYALTMAGPIGTQWYRCRCGSRRSRDRIASAWDTQQWCPIQVSDRPVSLGLYADFED